MHVIGKQVSFDGFLLEMKKDDLKVICIIPARLASSRFPNKPLAKIIDQPMILHVFNKVKDAAWNW